MASPKKISELTTAGPLTGAELVPVVQNGGTLQTTVSTLAAFATVSLLPVVSALQTEISQVSALTSNNAAAITSTNAVVSALDVRVAAVSASVSSLNIQMVAVQASISAINSVLAAIDVSAILAIEARVSALEIRVSSVSALVSANTASITSTNNVVSALEIRVSNASAAIVSTNAVVANVSALVSTLDIRLAAVSASVSALQIQLNDVSAALTSTNNIVSALEVRVSTVSAAVSVNAAAITSINAVVSTKVNRFGDFMDNVQYIEFDTSTVVPTSAGRLSWSIEEGTLDIGFDNQGVVLHTGLQLYQRVYNDTAATLPKGAVVRITGSQGQRLTAALALADSDTNSATTFAFMAEPVSVNGAGFAITEGVLKNVNTHAIPDGAVLWLSPVSAGVYTPTKPVAPQHLVPVGFVVKGNSTGAGSIYVKIINGLELGELHDVKVSSSTSLANGEVLAYDTSAGVWTNSTALINAQASISALNIQVAAVSALTSVNAASITSTNNVVSALEIRVSAVSAQASAIQSQVNAVSVLVSALDIRVAAVSASVSALQIQVNNVSAALTSTNNVVSALEIRVSAASATGATNSAAITSINAVLVSILAILNNTNFRITEA